MKHALLTLLVLSSSSLWSTAAPLSVTSIAEPIALSPAFLGYNSQTGGTPSPWNNKERLNALVRAAPALMRYPGGTISTYWDMRNDRVFKSGPEVDPDKDVVLNRNYIIGWMRNMTAQPKTNSLKNFGEIPKAFEPSNAAPGFIFVVNMVTPGHDYYEKLWKRPVDPTPLSDDWWTMLNDRFERNIEAIDRAKRNGLTIDHIELGNEFFFGITAEPYISGGQMFTQEPGHWKKDFYGKFITGAFPSLGISYAYAANDWAAKLKQRYPGALVSAVGGDTTRPDQADRRRDWNKNVVSLLDRSHIDAISLHIYINHPEGFDISQGEPALGSWTAYWVDHWNEMISLSAIPEDIDIWLTEWDIAFKKLPKDWAHALMGSFTLGQFIDSQQIRLTNFHQFTEAHKGGQLTPIAQALRLWTLATRGATQARRIHFLDAPLLKNSQLKTEDRSLSSLIAYQFTPKASSPRYLITNLSSKSQTIQTNTLPSYPAEALQSHHPDLSTQTEIPQKSLTLQPTLILPPYSITVLK